MCNVVEGVAGGFARRDNSDCCEALPAFAALPVSERHASASASSFTAGRAARFRHDGDGHETDPPQQLRAGAIGE
jgi:hypothetical protein